MGNPFLDRLAKASGSAHGNKSEKRVAKAVGAKPHLASGAMAGRKSDASDVEHGLRYEMKSTKHDTLPLDLQWLNKITEEASNHNQVPAIALSFVTPEGQSRMRHNADWVAVPSWYFKDLLASIKGEL